MFNDTTFLIIHVIWPIFFSAVVAAAITMISLHIKDESAKKSFGYSWYYYGLLLFITRIFIKEICR
ncbi:MAG: hypothetical protein ACOYK9_04440 [Chlamydiia bacterium]